MRVYVLSLRQVALLSSMIDMMGGLTPVQQQMLASYVERISRSWHDYTEDIAVGGTDGPQAVEARVLGDGSMTRRGGGRR